MTSIKERIAAITAKADELEAANKAARDNAKKANVKYEPVNAPSVIYKLRRDVDALELMIYSGLEAKIAGEKDAATKTAMEERLARFTDPSSATVIEVKEGDSVTDLLFNRYKDTKDIASKLEAACEKAGFKIDHAKNKIVKAN